jgi:hypothetical protein
MKLKYRNGGKPKLGVKELLEALEGNNPELMRESVDFIQADDKRGLNKLLNRSYREELKSAEEEGYSDLKTERKKKRAENKRLNKEFFDEMRSDDPGMEEGEESGGGMDKENWRKIIQALVTGGTGFGAMVGIPKLVNLLKKDKAPISGHHSGWWDGSHWNSGRDKKGFNKSSGGRD